MKKIIIINLTVIFLLLVILEGVASLYLNRNYSSFALYRAVLAVKALILSDSNSMAGQQDKERCKDACKLKAIREARKIRADSYPAYLHDPQFHRLGEPYFLNNPVDAKIIYCDEGSGLIAYESTSLGFRKSIDVKDNYNAVMVGDSYVEGSCVDTRYTFPYLLHLHGLYAYNLGKNGAGPLLELALVREFLKAIPLEDGSSVIWTVFAGNDVRNAREEKGTALLNYLMPEYGQHYVDNIRQYDQMLRDKLDYLVDQGEQRYGQYGPGGHNYGESLRIEDMDDDLDILEAAVGQAYRFVKQNGFDFKIALLENHPSYNSKEQKITSDRVRKIAATLNVPLCSVQLEPYEVRSHLTESGYQDAAGILGECLRK